MHRTKVEDTSGSILVVPDPRHHLFGMLILAQLASDDVLDSAHEWLCRRQRDYSPNADVWASRRDWLREKEHIKADLPSGNYRFSLLTRITLKDGEDTDLLGFMSKSAARVQPARHLRCTSGGGCGGRRADALTS